jgi:hypothetical protein
MPHSYALNLVIETTFSLDIPARRKMTPDERERMTALCNRIAVEENHQKFMQLVLELNDLLSRKEHRMEGDKPATSNE